MKWSIAAAPFFFCIVAQAKPAPLTIKMEAIEAPFERITNSLRLQTLTDSDLQDAEAMTGAILDAAQMFSDKDDTCDKQQAYLQNMILLASASRKFRLSIEGVLQTQSPQDLNPVFEVWRQISALRKKGHKDSKVKASPTANH